MVKALIKILVQNFKNWFT